MKGANLKLTYADTAGADNRKTISVQKATKMGGSEIYVLVIAIFMVLLFGYTSINKLLTTDIFIIQMQLVPIKLLNRAGPYLAWGVPILELVVLGLIIPDNTRHSALVASLFLMLVFEGYIIWLQSTGLRLPCTCGGIISRMSWVVHMIFNAVVIAFLTLAIYLDKRTWWNARLAAIPAEIRHISQKITTV